MTEDIIRILSSLDENTRLIKLPEVLHATGLKKTALYGMVRDGTFPSPIHLSQRSVAWVSTDVLNWIENKIAAEAEKRAAATRKNAIPEGRPQ